MEKMIKVDGTTLYHDAIRTIHDLRLENEKLIRMLRNVLDTSYGGAVHHIGDGDGLPESEAVEIREWWQQRLDATVAAYAGIRTTKGD